MTGRDLIIYILKNGLENEEIVIGGSIAFLMNADEAAAKFEVETETIKIWHELDMLPGIKIGDSLYFLKDAADPRKDMK